MIPSSLCRARSYDGSPRKAKAARGAAFRSSPPSPCGLRRGSLRFAKTGGARRDRTADLLHAMQALSQLSYGPGMPFADLTSRLYNQDPPHVSSSSSRPSPMMSVTSSSPSSCSSMKGASSVSSISISSSPSRRRHRSSCPGPRRPPPRARRIRRPASPAASASASLAGARAAAAAAAAGGRGRRRRCVGPARHRRRDDERRAALRAHDRILAEVVEFRAATAAETLRAELGFCHAFGILKRSSRPGKSGVSLGRLQCPCQ